MKQYKYPSFYFQILFLTVLALTGMGFSQNPIPSQNQTLRNFTDIDIRMSSVADSVIRENDISFSAASLGSVILYNIDLQNLTELDADSVVITQLLPPDVTFMASSFAPSSIQENLLSWTLDELKGNQSHQWDVTVMVNKTIPQDIDELVCFASFICSNDSVVTNNSVTEVVKVLRPDYGAHDVSVEVSVQTDSIVNRNGTIYPAVFENVKFSYSIHLLNAGPIDVENIQVVQELSENVISSFQRPAADNIVGRSMLWFFPMLKIGADTTISVEAMGAYAGEYPTLTNVRVSAANETLTENNSDSVSVWILENQKPKPTQCDVELTYEVLADSSIFVDGVEFKATRYYESFGYIINVQNNGPATARDVHVQNILPTGIGANLFNKMPEDSTSNGFTWTIDSLAVDESWSVSILVTASTAIIDFPHRAVSLATINAANDTSYSNNDKEAIVYILGDPIYPTDVSVKQKIDTDSVEIVGDERLPVLQQNEYYRITLDLSNWSQTDAEKVKLTYVVDDSLEILGTSPSSDVFSPDSVVWFFDSFLSNTTSRFIVDVQVSPLMPISRNLLYNTLFVTADNEDSDRTGNNSSLLKMVNYGVAAEPFEPSLVLTPENPSVSDSIRLRVSFPVEIVDWDLWVYLPSGEIITNFADMFIRSTSIQPGEWYDVDVPFVHRTLMENADADELIFEVRATGLYGIRATTRRSVFVVPGFELVPPNVVPPGSTEIPIDFVVPQGRVEIKVFDVSGRHIANLVDDDYPSGRHTLVWDGQTENGQLVGSGVYLITLHTEQANTYKKLIIVR